MRRRPSPSPTLNERDALLLEIGVEELPHKDVVAVTAQTGALVEKLLGELGLEHGPVNVWVTPRRIAIQIDDVPAKQPDVDKVARGPKKAAALDEDGGWKIPAQKFAEANGASTDDIYFETQGKFEYCFVKTQEQGKHLPELLDDFVVKLLRGIQFGKSMGWEDSTVTFSRPVRWLLALHGDQAVPVRWKLREASDIGPERALQSGRITYGHRRLAAGPVEIASVASYAQQLREGQVILDRAERLAMLKGRVAELAKAENLEPEWDDALFEEITDLVEWPEPIVGSIPEDALALPESIVITPMKVHQRYVPLRTKDGALSKHFVCVANGQHDDEGRAIIRGGNEKVLNARLRDAKYFWDTDIKTPLREFADGLSRVQFHEKLGSVADKIARIRVLFDALKSSLPAVDDAKMAELLTLLKADLTTQMVFEFDSLQGVVGMLYAKAQGIDPDIADAIREHWLPRRAGDATPSGVLGTVAGLLDRFDSLAGYFGVGIRQKGTSDPFGLRRNALAILTIVETADIDLDLEACLRAALNAYGDTITDADKALKDLLGFFRDRLDVLAREQGYAYDAVAAALAIHSGRPVQFLRCVEALKALDDASVQDLAEQAKRMQRIAKEPAARARRVDPRREGTADGGVAWGPARQGSRACRAGRLPGRGQSRARLGAGHRHVLRGDPRQR